LTLTYLLSASKPAVRLLQTRTREQKFNNNKKPSCR